MENIDKIKKDNFARNVILRDGGQVNAIGQGTWRMGEKHSEKSKEVKPGGKKPKLFQKKEVKHEALADQEEKVREVKKA